jgi:Tol biopolymer transport system component
MGEGVECPSISPDNRRIAFKKRVGTKPGTWRLAVRDLGTMRDRLVTAETRSIDDQVEWLDSNHILYAVPNPATAVNDIWMTDVDGSAAPKVFLAQAESPIVVR